MPSAFLSYSWDSDEHKAWVLALANRLQSSGVTTHLDQWDVRPGMDITRYMETSVRDSDFVLLVCTEKFARKANAGEGGVGYEKTIVTGEVFNKLAPETKFVPILREGDQKSSLPSYLRSKVFIDFREDGSFEIGINSLIRHLHGISEQERPPLGQKPNFHSVEHAQIASKPSKPAFDIANFEKLYRFAYGTDTLDMSKEDAIAWANERFNSVPEFDVVTYEKLFRFAYATHGLDMSKDEAITWANQKTSMVPKFDIVQYEKLYRFAYATDVLDMLREDAIAWADEKSKLVPTFDIAAYEKLFRFAYNTNGLDMEKSEAIAWANARMQLEV